MISESFSSNLTCHVPEKTKGHCSSFSSLGEPYKSHHPKVIPIMLLKTQWGLKNGAGGTRPTCHVLSECPCTALPGCQQSRHQLLGDDSPLPLQKSIQWHETRCKLVFSVHKYEESLYEVLNISLLSNFTHLPHFKKRKSTINVTSSTCFLLTVSSMTRRL